MTSPSAETNEPEPPLLKRTADDRKCSTQPTGGSKPCACFRCFRGRLLKTHIPSSAWAVRPAPRNAVAANGRTPERELTWSTPGGRCPCLRRPPGSIQAALHLAAFGQVAVGRGVPCPRHPDVDQHGDQNGEREQGQRGAF